MLRLSNRNEGRPMMKMTQKLLSITLRTARSAATMIGFAVMLALTVGLASTALAGTGVGASLDLGKVNVVGDVTTQLVGKVAGPTFTIVNQHDGKVGNNEQRAAPPPPGEPPPPIPDPTIIVPAPALGLEVSPGQTPITVNPQAGTAKDLSADELDGKDSSQFLASTGKAKDADRLDGLDSSSYLKTSGKASDSDRLDGKDSTAFASATNGKANDANLLDGKDSTAFVDPTRIYTKSAQRMNDQAGEGAGPIAHRSVSCDPGDVALGGGGYTTSELGQYQDTLVESGPQNSNGWHVIYRDGGTPNEIGVEVRCADLPPVR